MNIHERLAVFFERLNAAPGCSNHDEALELISATMNAVEDEHSGIPANPEAALLGVIDGRMYPPHPKYRFEVRPDLIRYRTRKQAVYIRGNGAIEIQAVDGQTLLTKPGSDVEGIGEI